MDTILYLYKKKEIEAPYVEAISQNTYLLVKIGMDVEPYRWFIQRLPRKCPQPEIIPFNGKKLKGWDWINPKYLKERREIRFRRNEWKRYEAQIDTLAEKCGANVESMLAGLMRELSCYVHDRSACWCVYEKAVRDVLYDENPVAGMWRKIWEAKEFTSYTELQWVLQLMPYAVHCHFIILGTSSCIPELVQQYAGSMKSLWWIMDTAYGESHSEELEDFAESFYQEQGLAVTIKLVQGKCGYERLQLACKEPSNILDFTGEDKVSAGWAAKGSVWLDMWSSEEKCRRIIRRGTEIQYFSLREKWSRTQKKKGYCLDFTNKNEYNT